MCLWIIHYPVDYPPLFIIHLQVDNVHCSEILCDTCIRYQITRYKRQKHKCSICCCCCRRAAAASELLQQILLLNKYSPLAAAVAGLPLRECCWQGAAAAAACGCCAQLLGAAAARGRWARLLRATARQLAMPSIGALPVSSEAKQPTGTSVRRT